MDEEQQVDKTIFCILIMIMDIEVLFVAKRSLILVPPSPSLSVPKFWAVSLTSLVNPLMNVVPSSPRAPVLFTLKVRIFFHWEEGIIERDINKSMRY